MRRDNDPGDTRCQRDLFIQYVHALKIAQQDFQSVKKKNQTANWGHGRVWAYLEESDVIIRVEFGHFPLGSRLRPKDVHLFIYAIVQKQVVAHPGTRKLKRQACENEEENSDCN